MMKVGMLRWGFILGYLCGPDVVTRVFIGKEGGRRLEREKDGVLSGGGGERGGERCCDAGLVDGGRRHQPRNAGGLLKLEKARKQLLP